MSEKIQTNFAEKKDFNGIALLYFDHFCSPFFEKFKLGFLIGREAFLTSTDSMEIQKISKYFRLFLIHKFRTL